MQDTEIEVQVKVENVQPLLNLLNESGKFVAEKRQVDEYFTPAHKDFTAIRPIKEWLRLRDEGNKYSITYKNWHYLDDGSSWHCDEYETTVENLNQAKKILSALDAKSLVTVNKTRKIWNHDDYEIAIDFIEGLGDFVEIEFKGEGSDREVQAVADKMIQFLKDLDCGELKLNNGGYPFLLMFPSEAAFQVV